MPVTDEHQEQFREEGWCLVRGLIPRQPLDDAWSRVQEITENKPNWPGRHFQVIDPDRYQTDQGESIPAGIQQPAGQEAVFGTLADHPDLAEAMARLLEGDVVRYTDQIGVKYGRLQENQGGCSYFHQDSYYWRTEPQLGCNCWIPMSDVAKDAIALAVMPGSHASWALAEHESYYDDPPMGSEIGGFRPFKRHRIKAELVDFSKEKLIPMQAGDGLFFTNFTWHRSEPNRTGRDMAFYAIAYNRAG